MNLKVNELNKRRIGVEDWLLTETIRHREESAGRCRDDGPALALARASDHDLPGRLVIRARALPGARAIIDDIVRMRRWLRRGAMLLAVFGLVGGWLAARASTADRHVDLLLASLALLGLPGLMLLLWLLVLLWSWRRPRAPSVLGRLLVASLARLAPRLLNGPQAAETARAGLDLLAGGLGRWYLSALSHLFWLAYAIGAMLTLFVLFSIAQYDLSWGTTLLSDTTVARWIQWMAAAPAQLGLVPSPDPAWVAAGREGALIGSARAEWARLLLAMVMLYAAAPRLLIGLVCALLAWRQARGLSLDRRQPGYLRLTPLLQPEPGVSQTLGDAPEARPDRPLRRARNHSGPSVLIGIELERSEQDWPPELPGIEALALGRADRRDQRRALLEALDNQREKPAVLLALCSLLRTPDAGIELLLNQLADAAGSALVLILDEGRELTGRGARLATRLADWQALARRVGADTIAVDLAGAKAGELAGLQQLIDQARSRK